MVLLCCYSMEKMITLSRQKFASPYPIPSWEMVEVDTAQSFIRNEHVLRWMLEVFVSDERLIELKELWQRFGLPLHALQMAYATQDGRAIDIWLEEVEHRIGEIEALSRPDMLNVRLASEVRDGYMLVADSGA